MNIPDFKVWLERTCQDAKRAGLSDQAVCLCLSEKLMEYLVRIDPLIKKEIISKKEERR